MARWWRDLATSTAAHLELLLLHLQLTLAATHLNLVLSPPSSSSTSSSSSSSTMTTPHVCQQPTQIQPPICICIGLEVYYIQGRVVK